MPRKSKKQRNAEQAERQQKVRDEAKELRRPSRDDIARMLLWQMIMSADNHKLGRRVALDRLRDNVVEGLESQGFDDQQSSDVFEELANRYSDGLFPFRPKRHLRTYMAI